MKGIDVSNYQGTINFNTVKNSGIEIVYIKATEGLTINDSMLQTYCTQAKTAGLKVGFYHYMHTNDPVSEAEHFLNAISGLDADCKYVLDVEDSSLQVSAADTSSRIVKFCEYIESKGKDVAIYTGKNFYENFVTGGARSYSLWVADYGVNDPGITGYAGWQYSESGSVSGISGNVDLDDFTDSILIKNEEEKEVENIVVYGNSVDRRAAEYLADALKCPTLDGTIQFTYDGVVKNVYCVGGAPAGGFTSYAKKIITGKDRFDTCQQVLDFISNGCK